MGSDMQNLLSIAMAILPPGFRFKPTDEEVVAIYLARGWQKFTVIPVIDICKFEPNQLPNQFKEKSMVRSNDPEGWFVCQQEPGQKAKRSTREGYWKITATPTEVKSRDTKQIIGSRRTLTFYKRVQGGKDIKSDWIMHEYYIPNDNARSSVICHVFLKVDDNAISKQDVNLHHTPEIHVNQINGSNLILGSGSISSPSISSADRMDFFADSDPEDCNFSEEQIQMQMKHLLPSYVPPYESIGHPRLCAAEDMEISSSSADQDYTSTLRVGEYELQAYCEQDTIIRDNTQSSNGTSESKLEGYGGNRLPPGHFFIDEYSSLLKKIKAKEVKKPAEDMEISSSSEDQDYPSTLRVGEYELQAYCEQDTIIRDNTQSSNGTSESKLEGYGENRLPPRHFLIDEYSSFSKKIKAKEVKKPATASRLVTKNSNHGSGINCKTESMRCPDGVCSSTPPIGYLVNLLLVGIVLLIFFIDQVF